VRYEVARSKRQGSNTPPGRVGCFQIRPTESELRTSEYPTRKGGGTFSSDLQRRSRHFPNTPPGRVGCFQIRPTERTAYIRIPHPEGWGTFSSDRHSGRGTTRIPHPEGWGTFKSDLQTRSRNSRIPHPEGSGAFRSELQSELRTSESPTRKGGVLSAPTDIAAVNECPRAASLRSVLHQLAKPPGGMLLSSPTWGPIE
jgi:hypothetical protein